MYCDFFLIRRVWRRKMNDNFFTEALFDLGGVRLSFVWISNPFVSDRVLKINRCPYRFLLLFWSFLPCCHTFNPSLCRLSLLQLSYVDLLRPCLLSQFFFHGFIGCSSSDIQYKFVIQHTQKKEKKKEAIKPKRGRCNGTNVPCEAPPPPRGTAPPFLP